MVWVVAGMAAAMAAGTLCPAWQAAAVPGGESPVGADLAGAVGEVSPGARARSWRIWLGNSAECVAGAGRWAAKAMCLEVVET